MATFPPVNTILPRQITVALANVREARRIGDPDSIVVAQSRLDRLLDRLPRTTPTAQEKQPT